MLATQIKTASDLKAFVQAAGHESHFFDRKTMAFFGDTMRNYGVRKTTINTNYDKDGDFVSESGAPREVFELYRKLPVKNGLQNSSYFDATTFKRVFSVKGC